MIENIINHISLIIPAYNEDKTIRKVIQEYRNFTIIDEIIVINNGSSDRTKEFAKNEGAKVIDCDEVGFGKALKIGFQSSKNDWIVKIDGDITNPSKKWIDSLIREVDNITGLVKG